ncbi:MAG: hypothetical protein WC838_07110 [Candidatus Margulisiibacteriota bacterium]|jgi:hypothetical protein
MSINFVSANVNNFDVSRKISITGRLGLGNDAIRAVTKSVEALEREMIAGIATWNSETEAKNNIDKQLGKNNPTPGLTPSIGVPSSTATNSLEAV